MDTKVSAEAESDANEWATRWAHREDIENGAQRLSFYKNRCFVISKYETVDLKYQIDGVISKKRVCLQYPF